MKAESGGGVGSGGAASASGGVSRSEGASKSGGLVRSEGVLRSKDAARSRSEGTSRSGGAVRSEGIQGSGGVARSEGASKSGGAVKSEGVSGSESATRSEGISGSRGAARSEGTSKSAGAARSGAVSGSGSAVKSEGISGSGSAVKSEGTSKSGGAVRSEGAWESESALRSEGASRSESAARSGAVSGSGSAARSEGVSGSGGAARSERAWGSGGRVSGGRVMKTEGQVNHGEAANSGSGVRNGDQVRPGGADRNGGEAKRGSGARRGGGDASKGQMRSERGGKSEGRGVTRAELYPSGQLKQMVTPSKIQRLIAQMDMERALEEDGDDFPGSRQWGAMAHLYEKVLAIVRQGPGQRQDTDIDQILPWFRKKSDLFKSLPSEIMRDIVKNCEFESCKKDKLIIRQGDKGNCFYIILSGTVAIHIITNLSEEEYENVRKRQEEEEALIEVEGPKGRPLDRSKYGNFIGKIATGKSFGELALINTDCVRNASIIADEDCDLLVVQRELYNRCLHTYQRQEFDEKMAFVASFPLFHNWHPKYKKMMAMSLVKTSVKFEDIIVKQGAPVDGLIFILSGQLKNVIDPGMHQSQYPDIFPAGSVADLEREKTRELLRKEMNLDRNKGAEKKPTFQKKKTCAEIKKNQKPVELCIMRAIDMIGDLELVSGLTTYSASVVCAEAASLYLLDQRNYDRLLEKRNPQALAVMRSIVHAKLDLHFTRIQESRLPLLRYILYTLDEGEKRRAAIQLNGKGGSGGGQDPRPAPLLWQADTVHRGPIINLYGPGSVFHMIRLREKERKKQLAQQAKPKVAFRFGIRPQHGQGQGQGLERPTVGVTALDSDGEERGVGEPMSLTPRIVHQGTTQPMVKRRPKSASDADGAATSLERGGSGSGSDSDDCFDWATSDYVLSRLEERIQKWHSRFEEPPPPAAALDAVGPGVFEPPPPSAIASSSNATSNSRSTSPSRTVKLHRYQLETDDKRPRPGNKVYLRLRPRPSNVNFLTLLEQERQISSEPSPSPRGHGSLLSRGSGRIFTYDPHSNQLTEVDPWEDQKGYHHSANRRPHTSPSSRFSFRVVRTKVRRKYSLDEYEALKEELRRRQKEYQSFLPLRPTKAIF